MNPCWHRTLAQVQALDAVRVQAFVAKRERGLPSRHLGKMGDKLGDARVLRENQLLGGSMELVARKPFELFEVAGELFDHHLPLSNEVYSHVF